MSDAPPQGRPGWPSPDATPVFDEPWEGRSFGLALQLAERLGLSWDDFRVELVAAIDSDPSRPYYESWVLALERLVTERTAIDADEIAHHRAHAAAYRYLEAETGDIEVFPIPTDGATLHAVLTDLVDASATIDDDIDRILPSCRHAELFRLWVDGAPSSWGFRMFDGDEDEQLSVQLPNPFVDADGTPTEEPDWGRLECWDALRSRHLGLAADPADRSGVRPAPPPS